MEHFLLSNMVKGWFVGNFEPTLIVTEAVEVAVKQYKKADYEERHFHKVSTEITVITKGRVEMNGKQFSTGDIIVLKPYESSDFRVLEDSTTTVVKIPGATNDKYWGEPSS